MIQLKRVPQGHENLFLKAMLGGLLKSFQMQNDLRRCACTSLLEVRTQRREDVEAIAVFSIEVISLHDDCSLRASAKQARIWPFDSSTAVQLSGSSQISERCRYLCTGLWDSAPSM